MSASDSHSPGSVLDALEGMTLPEPAASRAPVHSGPTPERFAWHLSPNGRSLRVDVLACHELQHGWREGDRLALKDLPESGGPQWAGLGSREQAALEALRAWSRKPDGLPFALLAALEGHGRLSWAAASGYAGYRVALMRELSTLLVSERKDGWQLSLSTRPGRGTAALRLDEDRVLFTGFTRTHQALGELLAQGPVIPHELGVRLAATLARWLPHLPLFTDLLPEPATAEARPDRALRLWLKGGNERLDVRAFVQPVRGLPWLLPGEGPRFVIAGPPQARQLWRRDLLLERRRLEQIQADLPRDAKPLGPPFSWRIQGRENVAAFLAALRDRGSRVQVEGIPGWTPAFPRKPQLAFTATQGKTDFTLEGTLDGEPLVSLLPGLRQASCFLTLRSGSILDLSGLTHLRQLAAWAEARGNSLRLPLQARPILAHLDPHIEDDVPTPIPESFKGALRSYQLAGFQWLARLTGAGLGACLADDMGLGKTVQTAALLAHRAPMGPSLVVAPTSVAFNWRSELARFTPSLQVQVLSEGDRARILAKAKAGDVVVASYGLLEDENLRAMIWGTVVLDEAHAIKNPETRRAQCSRQLRALARVALTGTPVENHPGELASLMGWLLPEIEDRFLAAKDADTLKLLAAPFLLRRRKGEVLKELPPRTDLTVRIDLDDAERAFHESLREKSRSEVASGNMLHLLAVLMKLRRACAHPSLADPSYTGPGAKIDWLLDRLGTLREEGHRCLVFSQFTDLLDLVQARLETTGFTFRRLDGSMPAKSRQRAVEDFQAGQADVFLVSLRAGGTGLNLTTADDVFHLDPWWNPAVEDQASDRAHRMGRTRPVTIHRLVAAGTIEEGVLALHDAKRLMVEELLEGQGQGKDLDRKTLLALLG